MKGTRKIMVAINDTLDHVSHGIRLAEEEKSWLTVLRVVPPFDGDLDLTSVKNIEDVLASGTEKTISDLRKVARETRTLIKTRVESGPIEQTIVDVAREERCDLIILSAPKRERSFLERLIGSSIIEKIISQAPCPVFVVPEGSVAAA